MATLEHAPQEDLERMAEQAKKREPEPLLPTEEARAGIDLEALAQRYVVEDAPFSVPLPEGERLWFKPITSKKALGKFIEGCVAWRMTLPEIGSEAEKDHELAGVLPQDQGEAWDAYLIQRLSVGVSTAENPDVMLPQPLTMRAACLFLKAPWIIKTIVDEIEIRNKTFSALFLAYLTREAKKNS